MAEVIQSEVQLDGILGQLSAVDPESLRDVAKRATDDVGNDRHVAQPSLADYRIRMGGQLRTHNVRPISGRPHDRLANASYRPAAGPLLARLCRRGMLRRISTSERTGGEKHARSDGHSDPVRRQPLMNRRIAQRHLQWQCRPYRHTS